MAQGAPLFFYYVTGWIDWAVWIFCMVIEAVALLHCLVQRAEAFQAIGTLSKPAWLGLIAGGLLLTAVSPVLGMGAIGIFSMIAITIAAVYLLDVRPALRDAVDGHGSW